MNSFEKYKITYLTKNYDDNSNTVSNTYLTAFIANAFSGAFVTNTYIENTYFDRVETTNSFASKAFVAQNYYDKASAVSNVYIKTIGFGFGHMGCHMKSAISVLKLLGN